MGTTSRLMLRCTVLAIAGIAIAGSLAYAGAAGAAPKTQGPQLVGPPRPGATLRVISPGSWHREDTTVTYAWLACDSVDCALITFGTNSTLVVPSDFDPNRVWQIIVQVIASNASGVTVTTLSSGIIAT